MNTKKWRTKEGKKIRIKDMEDSHILNTINLLERQLECAKRELPYPNFHGEMAQICAEQEFDNFMESTVEDHLPIYVDLVDEAVRRRILDETRTT